MEQALDLWIANFGGSNAPERRGRYIRLDPHYLDHTLLAVTPDGTIAATLHYWLYTLRDAMGEPRLVGAVSHVATREEYRRQGHAARLLTRSFDAMQAEGCEWTLLFSSDMGIPLYERHGFRRYSHPHRRGILTRRYPESTHPYSINRISLANIPVEWPHLAPIYEAYNTARPLSRVRDAAYWTAYFPMMVSRMFEDSNGALYTATAPGGELCGYLLAQFSTQEMARRQFNLDQVFTISEIGVLPHHSEAISALVTAALEATLPGNVGGRLFLPYEEPINTAADIIFGPSLNELDDRNMFARPLSATVTHDDMNAIFTAPGAHFWPIDDF
jgi:GNAT superfamily N-acetyltransferase